MIKRIPWKVQSQDHPGLSAESLAKANELLSTTTYRLNPPPTLEAQMRKPKARTPTDGRNPRLPIPGTIITRPYMGELLQVTINHNWDFLPG